MKKKFLALVLTLAMVLSLVPMTALATEGVTEETQADTQVEQEDEGTPSTNPDDPDASETVIVPEGKAAIGQTIYDTVKDAVEAAQSGATIILGKGNYTLYNVSSEGRTNGKDLTFIGQGAGETVWNMGTSVSGRANGGEDGDYSFDGSEKVTFKDMTLRSSVKDGTGDMVTRNNTGFVRIQHIVVDNCIIEGRTTYWGYTDTEFHNTKFYAPGHPELNGILKNNEIDYVLWTGTGTKYTFDTCTFYANTKIVHLYRDYGAGTTTVEINFNDCTVKNTGLALLSKQVLNIKDSNNNYIVNISGTNTVTGVNPNRKTCSRWFQVESVGEGKSHYATVNIDGKTVWKDGKMVSHAIDTAHDKYTDGYKDNAFTTTYGSWRWDQNENKLARTVTKTCQYCGTEVKSTEYKDLELDVSRSKIASDDLTKNSNGDWTTNVTLSLPSAEEKLESDVVFVIDRSQCEKEAAVAAQQLVDNLLKRQEVTKAKVKVGIVIFGGTAIVSRELSEVADAKDLQSAMSKVARKGLHGSNIQSGLIEADKMLSGDTTVANNRKYVVLISDGHTYQFSKEGDYYNDYTVGADKFSGLTTYGIYSETDLFAYDYGITYTLRSLKDEYFTGGWDASGNYTLANESYMTADKYKTDTSQTGVKNELEMPYGTWAEYLRHITEVVTSDSGKYDKALAYDSTGDYDNQCIGKSRDGYTKETRANKADSILGNDKYIKCGLDGAGNDNQLMHASGVDRSVYEAYTKYASMAKKYNCYPIYVSKDNTDPNNYDAAKTTQDYGYQLIHAMGEISHNTGTSVAVANEEITQDKIKVNVATAFSSIQNDILYAVGAGSVVEDKMGADFNFVPGSLKLTVDGEALDSKVDGDNSNITYFGAKNTTEKIGSDNYRFKVEYDSDNDKFTWTINENVSNFAPVQLSYQVKLVNANTAAGTYKVLTNEYAKLTPKNSAGQVGKELTFNNPEVSYTVSGGGGGGSHKPTVTIPDDVPTGLNGKDHYAYVVGYPDGMVYPQKNITRAEVATIFFRLLEDETREANMTKSNSYNDMKDGAWYTCAVSTLSKMGIIKGYEDGSFKPDASISRAEFAAIAARFDPDGDKTPATFSDVSSHWAKDEISIAANHGWIKGYEDGSFKPDQKITRAETMTLVNRVLKRLPETKDDLHKDMKTWPDNQNESAWFYLAVQEATNSHYQKLKKDGTHETWESMRETRDWAALEK